MKELLWVFAIVDVLLVFSCAVTPFLTRKTELFGVSLPADEIDRKELSAMRRGYLASSLVCGAVFIALNFIFFFRIASDQTLLWLYMALIFGYLAAEFAIYLVYHRKMKAFKAAQPWRAHGAKAAAAGADDASPVLVIDTQPPAADVVHPIWLWLYAVCFAAPLLYLKAAWPYLPERIPMHANAAGVVDGWIDKGPAALPMLLFGQWLVIGIFILVYFLIRASKRQIDAARPAATREQGRRFRLLMSGCMVFGGAALAGVTGFLPIKMAESDGQSVSIVLPLVLIFAITGAMLFLMVYAGQGGSRLKLKTPAAQPPAGMDKDDDRYWKLGVFYFNRDDPSFIVEKRFGIGYTSNFARPQSWLLFAGIAALLVVTLLLTRS